MLHPETVNWLKVHDRCVQGDKAAWEEIVEHFLPSLSQRLFRSRPDLDRHLIVESAEEALLDYWKNPQRFDATLGVPLGCWLHILARGHQSRLLRKERAYHKKEQAIGIEDKNFAQNATILSRKRPRIGYLLAEEVEQMNCSEEEIKIVSQFSSKERVALVLLKERASEEEWIRLLELEDRLPAEQERQIKKEKERIRKKRQRVTKESKAINGER
jgi:hypothetical protein